MHDRLAGEYDEGMLTRRVNGSWRDLSGFPCIQEKQMAGEKARVREQLRQSCTVMFHAAVDKIRHYDVGSGVQYFNMHDQSARHALRLLTDIYVPRCSTYEQCVSFYVTMKRCRHRLAGRRGGYDRERLTLYHRQKEYLQERVLRRFLACANATVDADNDPLVVARATPLASYFTFLGSEVVTCAVFSATQMPLARVLCCKACHVIFPNDDFGRDLAVACAFAMDTFSMGYTNQWYVEMLHEGEKYKVRSIVPIRGDNPADDVLESMSYFTSLMVNVLLGQNPNDAVVHYNIGAAATPDDLAARVRGGARRYHAERMVNMIVHNDSVVPAGAQHYINGGFIELVNLQAMFNGTYNLDTEYTRFCNPKGERPVGTNTSLFERDMQIQERTASLASLMARRSCNQMTKRAFIDSMLYTAQRQRGPMDLGDVLRAFSNVSLQRGPGSFHNIFRAPEAETEQEYKPVSDFVPLYRDTWTPLFVESNGWRNSIEPI